MGERVFDSRPEPSLSDFSTSERSLAPEKGIFRTLSAPVTIQWELTPACPESCVHCYNHWRKEDPNEKRDLYPKINLPILDQASQEIVENKIFQATVTGGEPLLVLDTAYPYLQRLAGNGVEITFNTNLILLTKEKSRQLKNLGVRGILTSLMSGDPVLNDSLANRPNTHRDVTKGIRLALEEGYWLGVNMVVTKKNLADIYNTARYIKSLGVQNFSATKASTPINGENFEEYALSQSELITMLDELQRVKNELGLNIDSLTFYPLCAFESQELRDFTAGRSCTAGKTQCTIGFDGQIRPCSHATQVYGSVLDEGGLKTAWTNLQPWRTNENTPAECSECSQKDWCKGGCKTEAFVRNGSLNKPDPYCDFSHLSPSRSPSPKIDINTDSMFMFHPAIKTRPETFGGIIFHSSGSWVPVTKELLSFHRSLSGESFNLKQLASALGLDSAEEVKMTAELLKRKSIIKEGR